MKKKLAINLINKELDQQLSKDKEQEKYIREMKTLASLIFSKDNKSLNKDFLLDYEFEETLKFVFLELTTLDIFAKFNSLNELYNKYNSRIRFYISVGYFFNNYCEIKKLELFLIKDDEDDKFIELINI